jgi:hypothetical protein
MHTSTLPMVPCTPAPMAKSGCISDSEKHSFFLLFFFLFSFSFFLWEWKHRKQSPSSQERGGHVNVARQHDVLRTSIVEKRLHHKGMLTEEELQKRVTDRLTPDLANAVFTTFEVWDTILVV